MEENRVHRPVSYTTLLFVALAAILLTSCGPAPVLKVSDAVVTLSPVDDNPSALYFTIHGGPDDVKLIGAFSSSALRSEIHESKMENGMMTMQKLDTVDIPAGEKVEFKQGGKHVMMWGINLVARRLGEMEVEFTFSNGDRILVDAVVQEADGSIPDERKAKGF